MPNLWNSEREAFLTQEDYYFPAETIARDPAMKSSINRIILGLATSLSDSSRQRAILRAETDNMPKYFVDLGPGIGAVNVIFESVLADEKASHLNEFIMGVSQATSFYSKKGIVDKHLLDTIHNECRRVLLHLKVHNHPSWTELKDAERSSLDKKFSLSE